MNRTSKKCTPGENLMSVIHSVKFPKAKNVVPPAILQSNYNQALALISDTLKNEPGAASDVQRFFTINTEHASKKELAKARNIDTQEYYLMFNKWMKALAKRYSEFKKLTASQEELEVRGKKADELEDEFRKYKESAEKEKAELREKLGNVQKTVLEQDEELEKKDAEIKKLTAAVTNVGDNLANTKKLLAAATSEIERLKKEAKTQAAELKESVRESMKKNLHDLRVEKKDLVAALKERDEENARLHKEISKLEQKLAGKDAEYAELIAKKDAEVSEVGIRLIQAEYRLTPYKEAYENLVRIRAIVTDGKRAENATETVSGAIYDNFYGLFREEIKNALIRIAIDSLDKLLKTPRATLVKMKVGEKNVIEIEEILAKYHLHLSAA